MKTRKLLRLRQANKLLRDKSQNNYETFLSILLRSVPDYPQVLSLRSKFESRDWTSVIAEADLISSTVFRTAHEHRVLNQLAAVIRKYPFPSDVVDLRPRERALKTFLGAEHRCSRLNRRFALYDSLRSPHEQALSSARSWIAYVIGYSPNLSNIWDHCNFGPGASVGVHGNATNMARKLLASSWSVSSSAYYYGIASMGGDIHIRELLSKQAGVPFFSMCNSVFRDGFAKRATIVDNNNIAFVPKTAKTERTIAIEPLINGYVQKGVDLVLRDFLKRVGIDLSDQSRNQEMARKGSIRGVADPYVTIDLSSASDSISIGLCRNLLPADWFSFLNEIRSKSYSLNGTVKRYHKFVSMGNGFCFPLETLIFASLCHVACQEKSQPFDFSVYGDDIIVRQSVADRVLQLLQICGFKANPDKTFISGPFRESCGADWFEGEDVRPLSLDYAFDSVENIFKFCNLSSSKDSWKAIFSECRDFLMSLVPSDLLFVRPYKGTVDSALEVEMDTFLASPFSRWNSKLQCFSWTELVKSAVPDVQVRRFAGYDVALIRGALTGSTSPVPFAERRKTRTKIRHVSYAAGWSLYLPGVCYRVDSYFF